jgi:Protein of unknown function (DUF433)
MLTSTSDKLTLGNFRKCRIIGSTLSFECYRHFCSAAWLRSPPDADRCKPVIRGTRLPVMVVVGRLAAGMTFEDVQCEYDVTADDSN